MPIFLFHFMMEGTTISDLMINEQIRDKEVRLVGADGEQLGIMSSREAYQKAVEAGLDLVKIAPKAQPPVCKIIDYGKYKYEQTRKEKDIVLEREDLPNGNVIYNVFTAEIKQRYSFTEF